MHKKGRTFKVLPNIWWRNGNWTRSDFHIYTFRYPTVRNVYGISIKLVRLNEEMIYGERCRYLQILCDRPYTVKIYDLHLTDLYNYLFCNNR